ncbi:MAG: RNA polymerase sigma factor [Puniceicoccales bacterium]|jgi:RNA polymerase sigma-70 factor (ECF subfamily)|nr:RNA polymerase sigma factor [Puniceicoccales bacterium]
MINTVPSPPTENTDENHTNIQLMRLIAQDDQQALRILVTKWQAPLINYFYRSLKNYQTAEDLTQSVFIRLYRNARTYQPTARFTTYLFHIARNVLLNEHRRQHRKPAHLYDTTTDPLQLPDKNDSQRRCADIEEAFANALVNLTENQRTALLLHKQQDLGYEEIARIMNATIPLIKAWIFRGRQKLRNILRDL